MTPHAIARPVTFAWLLTGLIALSILAASPARAHCQIPCGIFDDERTFDEMMEHAVTIERSLRGIAEAKNTHDITRWTMNKEAHAEKLQDMAQYYFLAQRVKIVAPDAPGYANYQTSLEMLHHIIIAAMRAKQSTEMSAVDTLKARIAAYEAHYWKLHGHTHD